MKKLKLLMSISTLCLAIMVLCFGVFSATNITYTMGGTVSYEVEDVYCKITTKVYKVEGQKTNEEMDSMVKTLSSASFTDIAKDSTYKLTQEFTPYNSYLASTEASATGINIAYGKDSQDNKLYYTYYIVINIENLSTLEKMYATINTDMSYNWCNNRVATNGWQEGFVKGGTPCNIVVGYSLIDLKETTKAQFKNNVVVKKGSYAEKFTDSDLEFYQSNNNDNGWSHSNGEHVFQSVTSSNEWSGPFLVGMISYSKVGLTYRIYFKAKVSSSITLSPYCEVDELKAKEITITTEYQEFYVDYTMKDSLYGAFVFYSSNWAGETLYIKDVRLERVY